MRVSINFGIVEMIFLLISCINLCLDILPQFCQLLFLLNNLFNTKYSVLSYPIDVFSTLSDWHIVMVLIWFVWSHKVNANGCLVGYSTGTSTAIKMYLFGILLIIYTSFNVNDYGYVSYFARAYAVVSTFEDAFIF